MGNKSRKINSEKRTRNNNILGVALGVLIGALFGYASGGNMIVSILICGLLGYGMGYAINKTIS
ncbi:MAG: hypothetical protein ACPGTP_05910 [Bacteroidia bacterium]